MTRSRRDKAVDRAVYAYNLKQHRTKHDKSACDAESKREVRNAIQDQTLTEQLDELGIRPIRIRH